MTQRSPEPVRRRSVRGALALRLAESEPAMLLYGGIVAAMAMALAATHAQAAWQVVVGVSLTLLVYWVAHVYVWTIGERLSEPGVGLGVRVVQSTYHEAPLLLGGVPTIAVFGALTLLWSDISTAAFAALWCTAALLAVAGYLAGYQAGIRGWRLLGETALSASFGLIAIAMKAWLH